MKLTEDIKQICQSVVLAAIFLGILLGGCGKSSTVSSGGGNPPPLTPTPTITSTPAQNGAVLVTISSTASGASLYYTLDGSLPDQYSTQTLSYAGPFLVASNLTVQAIAIAPGDAASDTASQAFKPNIPSGTLVWSDEFSNSTGASAQPNAQNWTYDTGLGSVCCGNSELETYCAWGSSVSPCNPVSPNAYTDTTGVLHIVAQNPSASVYTSARLKSQGLFSFMYGRIEARMLLPESQGMWPAFWLLGNNITSVNWPACGEQDVMEHIDGSNPQNEGYDWTQGSIHGTNLGTGTQYHPTGFSAAAWHTYGMIWSKGQVQYYVDSPTNVYATFTPTSQTGTWPFDSGPEFIILNLAVGGDWPGSPDSTTKFPSEIQVDYVRIYTN
ncbi:MAG: family 16 glycosylhydrolase [Terracidiphilus sp.]